MSTEFTIRVIDCTSGFCALLGAHDYRYEILNKDGQVVAASLFEDDANEWCFRYNVAASNRATKEKQTPKDLAIEVKR
jgi:hypothetical protein